MRYIFAPIGELTIMHIERTNGIGEPTSISVCGMDFRNSVPRTINITLGQPVCQKCLQQVRVGALEIRPPETGGQPS